MDIRAQLDKLKGVFSLGADNPYLYGGKSGEKKRARRGEAQDADMGYDEARPYAGEAAYPDGYPQQPYAPQGGYPGYQQPQGAYAPGYAQPQTAYAQPAYPQQAPYAPPAGQQAAYAQPVYQQPAYPQGAGYQQPYAPQAEYAQPAAQPGYAPDAQAETPAFQSQFAPNAHAQPAQAPAAQRKPRVARHGEQQQPENIVPFPVPEGARAVQPMDAYVINVFNLQSCRQAMTCLRRGQCVLIIMDQLTDRNETRRFVDMLTGACFALSGAMTRLSAKVPFYLMSPPGMTVYTDMVTSNANAAAPQPQMPLRQGAADFVANAIPEPPQMSFTASQPHSAYMPDENAQPPYENPGYAPYGAQQPAGGAYAYTEPRYAAQ